MQRVPTLTDRPSSSCPDTAGMNPKRPGEPVLSSFVFLDTTRSRSALAAENLFLRKQLTFFVERKQALRRTDNATRLTMETLARLFDWKEALDPTGIEAYRHWVRGGR